jgi:hypothetical protein
MWLGLYQSASIWLCAGPTGPQIAIVPHAQIGGLPMAIRIATAAAKMSGAATTARELRVIRGHCEV